MEDLAGVVGKLVDFEGSRQFDRYWTVRIPFAAIGRTCWHPTESTGPFAVLQRGCFNTLDKARAWAAEKLGNTAHSFLLFDGISGEVIGEIREPVLTVRQTVSKGRVLYMVSGPDGHLDLLARTTLEAALAAGRAYFLETRRYDVATGQWVLAE